MNKLKSIILLLFITIIVVSISQEIISIKSYQYDLITCVNGGNDNSCSNSYLFGESFYKLNACSIFQGGATTFSVDGNGDIKATTYSDQYCKIYDSSFLIPSEKCIVDCNSTNPILATIIPQDEIYIPSNSFSFITYLGDTCGAYKYDFNFIQYTIVDQCFNTKGGSSGIYSCSDSTISGKLYQQNNCTALSGSSTQVTGNSCVKGSIFSATICNQQ